MDLRLIATDNFLPQILLFPLSTAKAPRTLAITLLQPIGSLQHTVADLECTVTLETRRASREFSRLQSTIEKHTDVCLSNIAVQLMECPIQQLTQKNRSVRHYLRLRCRGATVESILI